ncbi:MAG: 5-(carboxyamino)imidazole ribonucleotide mutase [Methermicoccaceae archaeon]
MCKVAIIMGSKSDEHIANDAARVLEMNGVEYDVKVLSAHRELKKLEEYVRGSDALVFIAIAGLSAALAGMIASMTQRPVIGVPVSAELGGLDALLSTVQMPSGVPVACVGIDSGKNAALLAIRILEIAGATGDSPHP